MKRYIKIPLIVISAIILFPVLFILFLTICEYRPKAIEDVKFSSGSDKISANKEISLISWNIGYSGLGKFEDFFMDGGKKVQPDSKKIVQMYFSGIKDTFVKNPSDIIFMQEIDINSKRSYHINEVEELKSTVNKKSAFAYNFRCPYVPIPFPMIGQVNSGLATLHNFEIENACRLALPVPFKWPVSIANLKRGLLVERLPVYENNEKNGKYLVLINAHLEAYDSGEGKIAQTKMLMNILTSEFEKGNYVIAGGDFNQSFPGSTRFGKIWEKDWQPVNLELSSKFIEQGWSVVYDDTNPTCRSLSKPYTGSQAENREWQYYVLDGFLISPNVKNISVNVIDENFENSDHNPVLFKFMLK